jgi:hypothetical protein
MRIQVAHTFYLDFLLPRLDTPEPFVIQICLPDYDAYVMGWNRSEDLFHGETGQAMQSAEFSITAKDRRSGTLTYRVSDRVIDRIQVALEWDADSVPEVSEQLSDLCQERAVRWANEVLDHMRIATKVPGVRRIGRLWNLNEGRFQLSVPHTEVWTIKDDDTPIPTFAGYNALSSTGAFRAPETGALHWSDLCTSISNGDAPLHLTLLFEAEDFLAVLALRTSVLSMASACEIRGELFAESQSKISKTAAHNIKKPHDGLTFGERYFHLLTNEVCGRSLIQENPELLADIDAAYGERNKLMHLARFSDAFSRFNEADKHHKVQSWIASARRLCKWVDGLPLG